MNKPRTIWITGLPCSGKTTLAVALRTELSLRWPAVVLDGDELRKTLCSDLGYSEADRMENVRRVGSLCQILNEQGLVVIVAMVSPFAALRNLARTLIGDRFFEVYLSCPLSVCISRDTKGMYKKALAGELRDFTGISSSYQVPDSPDLALDSSQVGIEAEVAAVIVHGGLS